MEQLLWVVFFLSSALFLWMFIGYPFVLWIISLWKNEPMRNPITPFVTAIICTYNEARTIEKRLINLLDQIYPSDRIEIIVVDSNSPDGTADIVQKYIDQYPKRKIHLLKEESRRGKVSAINFGLSVANGNIIVLTDGPTIYNKDTIRLVVQNFADPSVGAATGNFVKYDLEGEIFSQETEWVVFNFRKNLRKLESIVDSTTWLSGELTCFRRKLVPSIPKSVIIDDVYIAMAVREQGFRVVVDERAVYTEKRPTIFKETIDIKRKSVIGSVQELVRFRKMLFSLKYRWYGLFILPARLLHFYLNPFILLAMAISFCWIFIKLGGISLFLACVGLIALLIALLGWLSHGKILRPLIAFLLMEWIIISGLYIYIRGDYSAAWKQVTTTRS